MRLKQYISETTPAHFIHSLSKDISIGLRKMKKKLESKNWEVSDKELVKLFNDSFKVQGIDFVLKSSRTKVGKWVIEAEFGGKGVEEGIPWKVYLRTGVSGFIKRFKKPDKAKFFTDTNLNQLAREINDTMQHEMLHAYQMLRAPEAWTGGGATDAAGEVAYLSEPLEIEANALSAAIDIWRFGKTKMIFRYRDAFGKDHKIFKKFMKKLVFYLPKVKQSGIKSFKFE